MNIGRKTTQRVPNSLAPAATARPWLPELAVAKVKFAVMSRCLPFISSAKVGTCLTGRGDRAGEFAMSMAKTPPSALNAPKPKRWLSSLTRISPRPSRPAKAGSAYSGVGVCLGQSASMSQSSGTLSGSTTRRCSAAEYEARPDARIFGQPGRNHAPVVAWSKVGRAKIA